MITISQPSISEIERGYINDVMCNGDWAGGPYVEKFEKAWSAKNEMDFGVACSNGTAALFLALKALGIGPGDEVIVPEFTMIACAWAVTYCGAKPVFVDCDDTLNMNPELLEQVLSKNTKAIMPVHIYGRKCSNKIFSFAKAHKLFIIEDMAEAHGIKPRGDIACYSFYGNKIITTGEGGMCLTKSVRLATEMKKLRNLYFDDARTMIHEKLGFNLRMTNIQAAIGLAQVERFDWIMERRKWIQDTYNKHLPNKYKMPDRDVLWVMDIQVDNPQKMKRRFKRNKVDTRFFFKPMSAQPMYQKPTTHLRAQYWADHGLYLPVWTEMSETTIRYICEILK